VAISLCDVLVEFIVREFRKVPNGRETNLRPRLETGILGNPNRAESYGAILADLLAELIEDSQARFAG